jgi:hypothetical protein
MRYSGLASIGDETANVWATSNLLHDTYAPTTIEITSLPHPHSNISSLDEGQIPERHLPILSS